MSWIDAYQQTTNRIGAANELPFPFNVTVSNDNYVKSFTTWHNGDCIKGFKFEFSDDSVAMLGHEAGDKHSHNFSADFLIRRIRLARTSWRGGKFDGMQIWAVGADLDKDAQYSWGNKGDSSDDSDYTSGVQFFGASAWIGSDVDVFQLVLSKPIKEYMWSGVEYDTSRLSSIALPDDIQKLWIYNGSSIPQQSVVSFSSSSTESSTHGFNWTFKVGVKFTFGGGPVRAAGGEISSEFTYGKFGETTSATTKQHVVNADPIVKAYSKMFVWSTLSEAKGSMPFTASLTMKYGDNIERTVPVTGTYYGVSATSFTISYNEEVALTDEEKARINNVQQVPAH